MFKTPSPAFGGDPAPAVVDQLDGGIPCLAADADLHDAGPFPEHEQRLPAGDHRIETAPLPSRGVGGDASHHVVKSGITLVPEGRLVFPQMTVMENLQLGAHVKPRTAIAALVEKAFALFPRLAERRSQLAGSMSGGEQQMLAIARGLMAEPKLIILDEPSLGLMPIVVQEVFRLIEAVNRSGIGVLLVEQNLHQSLRIAHRGYVLEKGSVVLSGSGQELLADSYVQKAFLGR